MMRNIIDNLIDLLGIFHKTKLRKNNQSTRFRNETKKTFRFPPVPTGQSTAYGSFSLELPEQVTTHM